MTPKLPAAYEWLDWEDGPLHLKQALKRYGVLEAPGKNDNETILDWAEELARETPCKVGVYQHDSTAWCGLFVAICLHKAGRDGLPINPLWALNWANYGILAGGGAQLGDVLVFTRKVVDAITGKVTTAGHVGFYVGEDTKHYHVLGGNQSDKVCIQLISKDRIWSIRRPPYIAKPPAVRRIFLNKTGAALSTNEA